MNEQKLKDNRKECSTWMAPEEFTCDCKPNLCQEQSKVGDSLEKENERLTVRIHDKVYYTKGAYKETIPAECTTQDVREILKRLADYEDKFNDDSLEQVYKHCEDLCKLLQVENKKYEDQIESLQQQNKAYEEALIFYADENNYNLEYMPVQNDKGKLARDALEVKNGT